MTMEQRWVRSYKTVSYPQPAQGDSEQYKVVTVHSGQLAELNVVAASPDGSTAAALTAVAPNAADLTAVDLTAVGLKVADVPLISVGTFDADALLLAAYPISVALPLLAADLVFADFARNPLKDTVH